MHRHTTIYCLVNIKSLNQLNQKKEPKEMPSSAPSECFGFRTAQIRRHRLRMARGDVVSSQTEHGQMSFGDLFIPAWFTTPASDTSSQACGIS